MWGDDIINSLIWIFIRTGQEMFSEKMWNFKMSWYFLISYPIFIIFCTVQSVGKFPTLSFQSYVSILEWISPLNSTLTIEKALEYYVKTLMSIILPLTYMYCREQTNKQTNPLSDWIFWTFFNSNHKFYARGPWSVCYQKTIQAYSNVFLNAYMGLIS